MQVYMVNNDRTRRWNWVPTPRSERNSDCDKCAFCRADRCPTVIPCENGYWADDKTFKPEAEK